MIDENALRSIEKLHEMKANGILTEAEFEEAKAKLLSGSKRSAASTPDRPQPGTAQNEWVAWAMMPMKRYAEFEGRSGRKEYWAFMAAIAIGAFVLTLIAMASMDSLGDLTGLGQLAFGILIIGLLCALIPAWAVQIRRFHDQGKSGWYTLLNFIPYIGAIVVLVFMALPGEEGANAYGPDPLA